LEVTVQDYEKLGVFYLGQTYDIESKRVSGQPLLYDSRDLVTHAVCVGMTGSGKTGLCIDLLEESAIDGIPAIVIDPKGDLANLLLTFPELRGQDFLPWVNPDDARKKGLTVEEYATRQAETWRTGLKDWGQDPDRIKRLRGSADFCIYTPGSGYGLPVSILKSFAAPDGALLQDSELLGERIETTVTGLLGLVGIEADPVKSREHILLSTILDWGWKQQKDLDLTELIQLVQSPPVERIGVLDVESFYPAKDRFELVLALNNVLAAPGFSDWLAGEPLDIDSILHTAEGKPRIAIFSIAHLNDAERMFFVCLLLNQVLSWVRAQSGTTSLRALLYMDEIFGFFPPVANPPSKPPLLSLLKQARAFGLGIVLTTQNPVDLDYKGLQNTGTWFIGRLQTERDKARVMEGLEGVMMAAGGGRFKKGELERILAGLDARVFLMHNVHEDQPIVFESRWAMSYLAGPLTRNQIKTLMDPARSSQPEVSRAGVAKAGGAPISATSAGASSSAPALPPDVPQFYIPVRGSGPSGAGLVYRPMLVGAARVRFVDKKSEVDESQERVLLTPITDQAIPVDWDQAQAANVEVTELEKKAEGDAMYAGLPGAAAKGASYETWGKSFARWLYDTQSLELHRSPSLGELSKPGESEREFRIRLAQLSRERRDEAAEKLRARYAPKLTALQDRLRRAEQAQEREEQQAEQQKAQTVISVGSTILGAFVGRKALSATTLGRATTAARGVSRSMKERDDIARAQENVKVLQDRLAELEEAFKAETDEVASAIDPSTEELESVTVKPRKTDIAVELMALAWSPYWEGPGVEPRPAWG
jgi:hypothetical protein